MAAGYFGPVLTQMYMYIHLFENPPENGEKSPIDLQKCTLMFFQSRCNTFVTFVYFYIRLFGKKLEKSRLTERQKCEQKCAKKWLCAICIVGDLENMGEIVERFRAIRRLTQQNSEDLLLESAPWRKIIHRNTGNHSSVV